MHHRLGGSLRAADGLRHVVLQARALGYECLQTMTAGTRDYDPMEIHPKDAAEYRATTYGIATYVHLPYTINPCETTANRRGFYKKTFKDHLIQAATLGAKAVIMHPGFRKENTEETAQAALQRFLEETLDEDPGLDVLLETDSGSKNGSAIGSPEFLKEAITTLDHDRVGMCLDTCHLYARGTNLWDTTTLEAYLRDFGRATRLVHLNVPDPDVELGSHRDRHNTPFRERPDLDSGPMIKTLAARYDLILERRSLAVQEQDASYIRGLLKPPEPTPPKLEELPTSTTD